MEIPHFALITLWPHKPISLSLPLGYHSRICTLLLPFFFHNCIFVFRGDEHISAGLSTKCWKLGSHEVGKVSDRRKPKVTNRLMSKTSRFCPASSPLEVLPSVLDPVGGPLKGGDPSDPNILSDPMPGVVDSGRVTRLEPGLLNVAPSVKGGSISRAERNDVLSRSVLVLVMVRNESRRLFCPVFGVPFKSSI